LFLDIETEFVLCEVGIDYSYKILIKSNLQTTAEKKMTRNHTQEITVIRPKGSFNFRSLYQT